MAPLFLIDRPKRDMSPEGQRATALAEMRAPATCRVPRTWDDIRYTDWLFRFTDECDISIDIICMPIAITAIIFDIIFVGASLLSGSGPGVLLIGAGVAALASIPAYLQAMSKGQMLHAGPVSYFFAALRMRRIHRREMRRATRAAKRLNARNGWRPREGIPHPKGREDIYDRYLVEAHATELGVAIGLRHWKCDEGRVWMPAEELTEACWFDGTDGEELANYQAELEGRIPALEKHAQEELTTGRAKQEFVLDQMRPRRELAEHINEQAVARI